MEIAFQRSGGFAGLTMATDVDTAKLPPDEARELERLVDCVETSGAGQSKPVGKPDRFQYDLTIKRDGESRHLQLAEQNLTPEARALVKLLLERARKARPEPS